ncbi:hypothetical protein CKM354_000572200 [Cercospora kikuchii]|uniref:AB hydrolase-1 domain-containing protein n=1 Tax=Cercospora kikuchii TaxID=84275 RepID=A0A9P3FFU1_9PEZI|nr:uncharacterized protein CKM354_000572200 [Cercospora kikuchii]GIZ42452.1 hypothetical protein CKM354_000572200 [Cercospora kikuchii]
MPKDEVLCFILKDTTIMSGNNIHFVLIHGAYHRAWHLHLLATRLKDAGFRVSTVDLPSVNPNIEEVLHEGALRADVEAAKVVLEQAAAESDTIVPVCHSYGGVVGGEAAAELSEKAKTKVQRIVYLCAIVLQQGNSLTTRTNGQVASWARHEGHAVVVPDPVSCFYQDVDPQLAQEAAKHVHPHSYSAFTEATRHAPWRQFPCTYVYTTEDLALPLSIQQILVGLLSEEERANFDFFTLEGGHSPFLSKPDECVKILKQLVGQ